MIKYQGQETAADEHSQGRNFGLKTGGTDSGGKNVTPYSAHELSGWVQGGDPAENGLV